MPCTSSSGGPTGSPDAGSESTSRASGTVLRSARMPWTPRRPASLSERGPACACAARVAWGAIGFSPSLWGPAFPGDGGHRAVLIHVLRAPAAARVEAVVQARPDGPATPGPADRYRRPADLAGSRWQT